VAEALIDDFAWFTAWVHQHLGVCVTFARGVSQQQLVERLGLRSGSMAEQTFEDVCSDVTHPKVRVGQFGAWAYAVEHLTTIGAAPATLRRLSERRSEALSLAYTQTASTFLYAANGVLLSGFDLTAPHIRYGSEPHRFDTSIEQAGFLQPEGPDPPAMGARFVQLTFGFTIDQQMLSQALPSFDASPTEAAGRGSW